jgi:hypothetical protein
MIRQELLRGRSKFNVQEDGTETVTYLPPTALDIRAARSIEEQLNVRQGLERALNILQNDLNAALRELDMLKGVKSGIPDDPAALI